MSETVQLGENELRDIGASLLLVPFCLLLVPGVSSILERRVYFRVDAVGRSRDPRHVVGFLLVWIANVGPLLLLIEQHRTFKTTSFWTDTLKLFTYITIPVAIATLRPLASLPMDIMDVLMVISILVC
jgi:hypothetical protein